MQINREMAIQIAYVQMYIFHTKDVYIPNIVIRNFRDRLLLRRAYDMAMNFFQINHVQVKLG